MSGQPEPIVRNPSLVPLLRERVSDADLDGIERLLSQWGVLTLPSLPNGMYAAVGRMHAGNAYTGYGNTWVRDTVHIAHAVWERGDVGQAARTARTLLDWFETQAGRFEACISGAADPADPMQRPHIRFRGATLEEIPDWWPHAQNDALGYALWFLSRAALAGLLPLDSRSARILQRFARYFAAIRYWQDRDSGHWEEARKLQCSSVGAVVGGLLSYRGLLRSRHEPCADIDELLLRGRELLLATLPAESAGNADTTLDRRADSALLFLVHPLRVVPEQLVEPILDAVRTQLLGPFGIRRYNGDSYWMADYTRLFDERTRTSGFEDNVAARDRFLQPGTEAQWCLFDPLLSVIHGWRYLARRDPRELELQCWHFRRALGQLTGPESPGGEGLCPEAYYLADSREPGRWIANDDTPLLWVQACVGSALQSMRNSVGATRP